MKSLLLIIAILVSGTIASAQPNTSKLETVNPFDLNKYLGKWYEIAKYPNRFQKQCVGNVTATYSKKSNDRIEVLNECLKKDGVMEAAKAEGKFADKSSISKLKVRFAPSILSFLPFVWANYWIIDIGPNYEYAVVGEPNRKYFWILSREPVMNDLTYQNILKRAEAMGYDSGKVVRTPQDLDPAKGAARNRS